MNRTMLGTLLTLSLLTAGSGYGQAVAVQSAGPVATVAWVDEPEEQEGPDQTLYKKGYDLVLDEKWDAARKQFTELFDKYPKSDYTDDARYWSSYALMHTDLQQALKSYQEFMKKYPQSSYADDAMADMHSIQAQLELARATGKLDNLPEHLPQGLTPHAGVAPRAYVLGNRMRHVERSMRLLNKRIGRAMVYSPASFMADEKKLDAKTRLKLDALQAIGENTEDEKGFATLKEVALDVRQPLVLRKEALGLLSRFENQDVDAVYLEVVRRDTSEDMQVVAIENLGESSKNKERTIETLVELYTSLPAAKEDQRATALYRIADIGNDRAVDFLSRVARSDADYDMRSDAVYYLGNIGGEKARGVLFEILKGE